MRINHNISAQLANVNLKRADRRGASALESLSSGYKINKAADDSVGMAISNKMRTQIRSLEQASRNAEDGTSIIRTAEGALSEIEAVLQRTRELSVQAADDANTIGDRSAMQEEIDALLDEIDRIAETTEFNGKGLLDGSSTRVVTFDDIGLGSLGVSEEVPQGTYELTVTSLAGKAAGSVQYDVPDSVIINGVTVDIGAGDSDDDVFEKIQSVCNELGILASKGNSGTVNLSTRAVGSDQFIEVKDKLNRDGRSTRGADAQVTLGNGFNAATMHTACSGNNITITDSTGFEMNLTVEDGIRANDTRTITVYDSGRMQLQIGANEHQDLGVDFPKISTETLKLRQGDGVDIVNVCSNKGASNAITAFDKAIESVSAYRSNLGAYENRLDTTIASLDVSVENVTDSMSRITDTDMAEAMTQYTQEGVLSQAATAILAQANNRPQTIMSLLQS